MPVKSVEVPDLGTVKLYKRRGLRSIRLSISQEGYIRVSLPPAVPYRFALDFVTAKRDWIEKHRTAPNAHLQDGARIGKAHQLVFSPSTSAQRISTRIALNEVKITYPHFIDDSDGRLQIAAKSASIRALKQEAEKLLPPRLAILANTYGFTYESVSIKQLKSRWGSCDAFNFAVKAWLCIAWLLGVAFLLPVNSVQIRPKIPDYGLNVLCGLVRV